MLDTLRGAFRRAPDPDAALRAEIVSRVPAMAGVFNAPRPGTDRGLNAALRAETRTIVSTLALAETGRIGPYIDLCRSERILSSRLDAVCNGRASALTGKPIVWMPPPGKENDPKALDYAARMGRLWNSTPHTGALIAHLQHAQLESVAAAELEWSQDIATGYLRASPRNAVAGFVHPNRLGWNAEIQLCRVDADSPWPGTPLSKYPDQFVTFAPLGGRSDYPWRRGAMRSRLIPSMLRRRIGINGWTQMLERWGQPQIIAYEAESEDHDAILEALRQIGIDWRAAFPAGTKVEPIPVSVDGELHARFVEFQNTEDAIAILGQNLTTEAGGGGGYAAVQAHRRVLHEILTSDAFELGECLTHQIAEPTFRWNGWPMDLVPYAQFVLTPKRELTVTEYQTGLFTRDEVAMSMGYEAEPDGAGNRYFDGNPNAGTPAASEPSNPSDTKQPGASKPDDAGPGMIGLPSGDATSAAPADSTAPEKAADAALNGAQIASLAEIIASVERGERAPATAVRLILLGFPQITAADAQALIDTIKPSATPAAPPAPTP